MTGDRWIRRLTFAVVLVVAAFAAVVSYSHIYDLGRNRGQSGTAARLLPLSVDGLIVAASLVLLHEARNGRSAPALARLMLWLGIGATVGANIAYGAGYGLLGALVSAWPAVAFIGSAEMAITMVRRSRRPGAPDPAPDAPGVPAPDVPAPDDVPEAHPESEPAPDAPGVPAPDVPAPGVRTRSAAPTPDAIAAEFAPEIAAHTVPSLRAIRTRLHVGQDRAASIQAHLMAMAPNGQHATEVTQ